MKKFVIYFRVSTEGQETENQRNAVECFLKNQGQHEVLEEFHEIESGRNDNRPELNKAIKLCLEHDAILIVAKLDRLSRSLNFILKLQKSKVRFKACDMPEADEFTIQIIAAVAQREQRLISERTKAGLQRARAAGKIFGVNHGNNWGGDEGRAKAAAVLEKNRIAFAEKLRPIVNDMLAMGINKNQMAKMLNRWNIPTPRNGQWQMSSVKRLLQTLGKE